MPTPPKSASSGLLIDSEFAVTAGPAAAENLCVLRVQELAGGFKTLSEYSNSTTTGELFKPDASITHHFSNFLSRLKADDLKDTALACGLTIELPFQDEYCLFVGRERPNLKTDEKTHYTNNMDWLSDLNGFRRSLEEFDLHTLGEGVQIWVVHNDHCKTRHKLNYGSKTTLSGHKLSVRSAILHEGGGLTQQNIEDFTLSSLGLTLTLFTGSMQSLCSPVPVVAFSSPQYGLLVPSVLEMMGYIIREFTENSPQGMLPVEADTKGAAALTPNSEVKAVLDPRTPKNKDLLPSLNEMLDLINPNLGRMQEIYNTKNDGEGSKGSALPISAMAWHKLHCELKNALPKSLQFDLCLPVESLARLKSHFPATDHSPSAQMLLNRMVVDLHMLEINQYVDDDALPLAVNLYSKTEPRVHLLQKTQQSQNPSERWYGQEKPLQPSLAFTDKEAAFQYAEQLNEIEGDLDNPYQVFNALGDLAENWMDFLHGYVIKEK